MANTREVKTRLRGIRKTQQITRAMKMVAAVKLRHAQAALANSRPYAERMRSLAADLLARIDQADPPDSFFLQRQVARAVPRREKILLIIVAADRGLCGNMNTNIFRQALRVLDDLNLPGRKDKKPEINLFLIGRKTKDFFRAHQNAQTEALPYRIREAVNFAGIDAGQLGRQCCELYRKGEFDRVELFYNESFSALQHRPVRTTLLPLNLAQMRKDTLPPTALPAGLRAGPAAGNVLFEPAIAAMLDDFICSYIASEVRRILMEAEVAEHAARMLMMDLATKNADDLISAMQLTMNKLRQLSITNELEDITTGAEAVG